MDHLRRTPPKVQYHDFSGIPNGVKTARIVLEIVNVASMRMTNVDAKELQVEQDKGRSDQQQAYHGIADGSSSAYLIYLPVTGLKPKKLTIKIEDLGRKDAFG